MTLDGFIEASCTNKANKKTSQTDAHFLPESFKKLHEEDCCIAEHLGINPYYVLGALYENTTQYKTTLDKFSTVPISNYAQEQAIKNKTEDTIQFKWIFILFSVIVVFYFFPDILDTFSNNEPPSDKVPIQTQINFSNNQMTEQDEWWGHMPDENDIYLLEKCRSIARELKINPNIITEAYYSSRFEKNMLGMTHCENGKNLIRIRYNLANNNNAFGENEVIVHEVCHAISYKRGFLGHTPLWVGYMRQYAKLHPELAKAIEYDVRRYEAGFLGGIE